MVELKDEAHLLTYSFFTNGMDPDVDPEEMKKSDSKDKFVFSSCWRRTKCLNLPSREIQEEKPDILKLMAENHEKMKNEMKSWSTEDWERVLTRPSYNMNTFLYSAARSDDA